METAKINTEVVGGEDHRIFLERFGKLKDQYDFSDYAVASALGLTQPAVYNLSRGIKKPSYSTLEKLSKVFDVSVDYLLGRTDKPEINK